MRSLPAFLLVLVSLGSCADKPHPDNEPEVILPTKPNTQGSADRASGPLSFEQIDDNISHDTLLIQTTFDMKDGTYIMVASNNKAEEMLDAGDRNAGLRLYHYRLLEDGSPQILATSSSASDSWTMFPTFFEHPTQDDSQVIFANFGDRNSWGQKVIRFGDGAFEDLGFLDVAAIEQIVRDEEVDTKLLNLAPQTIVTAEGNDLIFKFTSDEVHLYDDQRGTLNQAIAGDRVTYRWNATDGMVLYIDGEARPKQEPS